MSIPVPLQSRLRANGITPGMPGWTIVDNARLLPPIPNSGALFGDQPAQALTKLTKAFFQFGRTRWKWTTSSNRTAANGGLVKGLVSNCACSMFNDNLKFLAETCAGMTGIRREDLNTHFLTMPGNGSCIDAGWHGNVQTDRANFAQFGCYKFSTHYWLSMAGMNYDACYGNVFASRDQIIFTTLVPDPAMCRKYKLSEAKLRKLQKPLPAYTHLYEVLPGGQGPGGWPGFQLVSEKHLKMLV